MTGISSVSEKAHKFEGFDRVFPLIGGHGLYQWLLLLIVAFQRGMYVFQNIGYIYLGASPDHWCHVEELSNSSNWSPAQIKSLAIPSGAECEYYDFDYGAILRETPAFEDALAYMQRMRESEALTTKPCVSWEYDTSTYHSTTVTQFDLVCGRKHLVATIHSTYMAGVFFGSLVLGAVSDKLLGRRRTALLCFGLMIVFGFLTSYANSYFLFVLCRFAIAVGVAGANQNCFTILMEYTDTSARAGLGILTEVSFALFYMLLPLYAYLLRDWAQLSFAFAVSSLPLLLYFFFLPESSRWLTQNGREEEALDTLQTIAARNRRQPPPDRAELKTILDQSCEPPAPKVVASTHQTLVTGFRRFLSSYVNLVRTPELRRRSFLIWFLYMSAAFCYYGVSFGSPSLSSDPFLIVFLGGLMEVPGYLGCIPLVSFWGRKPTTASTLLIAGVAYFGVAFVPFRLSFLRITLALVAKLFVSGTTAVIILLGAELYPTEARSTGLGLAVLFGRIGSMAAPYVVRAKFGYTETSLVVIGLVAVVAGVVALLLPETKDEEMFEKVGNIENVVARRRSSVHVEELQALNQMKGEGGKGEVKEKKCEI